MKFRRGTKSFMSSKWDRDSGYEKKPNPTVSLLLFILGILGAIELIRKFLD